MRSKNATFYRVCIIKDNDADVYFLDVLQSNSQCSNPFGMAVRSSVAIKINLNDSNFANIELALKSSNDDKNGQI